MLDQSSHDSRVRWMRETTAADQAKLWDLALHGETSLEDLVPSHIPDGQEVVHIGYNSLPALQDFELALLPTSRECRSPLRLQRRTDPSTDWAGILCRRLLSRTKRSRCKLL